MKVLASVFKYVPWSWSYFVHIGRLTLLSTLNPTLAWWPFTCLISKWICPTRIALSIFEIHITFLFSNCFQLSEHMARMHCTDKDYRCPNCGEEFAIRKDMIAHYNKKCFPLPGCKPLIMSEVPPEMCYKKFPGQNVQARNRPAPFKHLLS